MFVFGSVEAAGGIITTVAGGGVGDGGSATSASLYQPNGVAVDGGGNLYIADTPNHRVRKVSGGTITTVAGNGTDAYSGDGGPATNASLNWPYGVAVDAGGNLYIADTVNCRVRKVSGGIITTVAGNGTCAYGGDGGPATSASLGSPDGVAVDGGGNLYIADTGSCRVREVSGGIITTVAGAGTCAYSGDGGPATSASLNSPVGLAVDGGGNLYIADTSNCRVREVSGGIITTVAGNGTCAYSGDGGLATSASLNSPWGVVVDGGNLYIADTSNCRVRKVSGGTITAVAGNGTCAYSGDGGPATGAGLSLPRGVAVGGGDLYIVDTLGCRVRKVSGGTITTVAGGTCSYGGDGGPATSAGLYNPSRVAVDGGGNLYIADRLNCRVREVIAGTITTVAGNGTCAYGGDGGPATSASLYSPNDVAVDGGDLYIADTVNCRVRKVSAGTITTVAGNGTCGYGGDGGPATSASLNGPDAMAVDGGGNVYIADDYICRVRKVSGGTITTVAGNGTCGGGGDGGPATSASLDWPDGVAADVGGNLYIADYNNCRVRKVSGGTITAVAGTGTCGYGGDGGPATSARLNALMGVAVDGGGNLYITDTGNNRVRKVTLAVQPSVGGIAEQPDVARLPAQSATSTSEHGVVLEFGIAVLALIIVAAGGWTVTRRRRMRRSSGT